MATRTVAIGGGNSNTAGTYVENAVPTSADDIVFLAAGASGAYTINAALACRSLDFTNYTNTCTHNAGITVTIGTTTAGPGNVALKLVSGMTYTLGNAATSAITFNSTSGTQQTVDFGGKTVGNLTFSGAGGSWLLNSNATTAGTLTHTAGTLNYGTGRTHTIAIMNWSSATTRVVTLSDAAIAMSGNFTQGTTTNQTISTNTATITQTGATAIFSAGSGLNYNGLTLVQSGAGLVTLPNSFRLGALTRTGTAATSDFLSIGGTITVDGLFNATGQSLINRLNVIATATGTAATISAGSVSLTNVDFRDITGSGSAAPFTGTSLGDAANNSGITFDTPANQFWVGNAGSWSDSANHWASSSGGTAGTGRIPLLQDTAKFDAASFSSNTQTVTLDMPRLCKVDCTGQNNTAITFSGAVSWFGSIIFTGNEQFASGNLVTLQGGGSHVLTSFKGTGTAQSVTLNCPGGTYTLTNNFVTAANAFTITRGTLDMAGFTIQAGSFASNNSNTRALTMGTGTFNLTSTGTIWNVTNSLTLSAASGTIAVTTASASARTFTGGGLTYGTLTYTVAGSTGSLTLDGNTINTINFSDATNARSLLVNSGTTITVTNIDNIRGTAGKLMSFKAVTPGSAFTIVKTSGTVSTDYLSIQDSNAGGGATFYAGANSSDANPTSTTGWIYSAPLVTGAAALDGSGSLTSSGIGLAIAAAALSGSGTATSAGLGIVIASGTLTGSGTLTSGSLVTAFAAAVLTGNGTLSDTGTVIRFGDVSLASDGTVTVTSLVFVLAASSLSGTGTLTAEAAASALITGAAALTAAGNLTASGALLIFAAALLTANGTLTASGGVKLPALIESGPTSVRLTSTARSLTLVDSRRHVRGVNE